MQLLTGKQSRVCRPKAAGKESEQGFTLIETAIALVVMLVAGLAVSSLFVYAINYNSGAYDRTLALAVAQQRMENIRRGSFSEVVSSNVSKVKSANRSFNVATTVTGTTLKNITVTVTPQSSGGGWSRTPVVIMSQRASTSTGIYF
jgi:prepilin-type N-terminal cleavage/methylation domain-containing protein